MEGGRDEDMAQRAEGPVHIRMNEDGVEAEQGGREERCRRRKAQQQKGRGEEDIADDFIHRVTAEGAEPVKLPRAVMHRVEGPQPPPVKQPMNPVEQEITQHDCARALQPRLLPKTCSMVPNTSSRNKTLTTAWRMGVSTAVSVKVRSAVIRRRTSSFCF